MLKTINLPIKNIGTARVGLNERGGLRALIPRAAAINLYRKATLESIGLFKNNQDIFSVSSDVLDNRVIFMSFTAQRYGLRPKGNGCEWNPQLRAVQANNGITLYGIVAQLEMCPDELMGSCFRQLLGAGNGINDIFATEGSRLLFTEALGAIFEGIGLDLDTLMWFGNHPLIAAANTAGVTNLDDADWLRFYSGNYNTTQLPSGYLTLVDGLKADGVPNYSIGISPALMSGSVYNGDALALLQQVKDGSTSRMKQAVNANPGRAKFLVSRNIYAKIAAQLGAVGLVSGNDALIRALLNGKEDSIGYNSEYLTWNGHRIIPMDIWNELDDATTTTSARVLFTFDGNLGIGYDVRVLNNLGDIAMEIEQRLGPGPDAGGKTYGEWNIQIGFGIIDQDYATYASYVSTIA